MADRLKNISSSSLVRNSAKLLSANVLAQALALLVYPILTRLYTPEDFGALNLFLSLGGIIALLSTAELQYAIVLPKDENKAWRLIQCGVVVLLTVAALTLGLTPIFSHCTNLSTGHSALLAPYVLFMGLWTLLNYWYTREKQFGAISRYQIGQSISSSAIKIGLGYAPFGGGLIYGSVLAPLIGLLTTWFTAGRRLIGHRWRTAFVKKEMREALREYRNFPCYNLPRSLVGNLGSNLPSLLLAPVFGLTELGFFGMALTLAFRPINMISASIYQVLFQQFSERYNHQSSIISIYRKYISRAALIAISGFAALWFVLPWLCRILLGEGWEITGEYIRWMLPWLLCSLLVAPVCSLCDVFGEQKKGFLFEILLTIARLGGIGIGLLTHNFLYAVIGYSLGNALIMAAQLVWYTGLVHRYEAARRAS